jgi:hypothetical protein
MKEKGVSTTKLDNGRALEWILTPSHTASHPPSSTLSLPPKPDMLGVNALFHRETLILVNASDVEGVAFPFVAEGVTGNLMRWREEERRGRSAYSHF